MKFQTVLTVLGFLVAHFAFAGGCPSLTGTYTIVSTTINGASQANPSTVLNISQAACHEVKVTPNDGDPTDIQDVIVDGTTHDFGATSEGVTTTLNSHFTANGLTGVLGVRFDNDPTPQPSVGTFTLSLNKKTLTEEVSSEGSDVVITATLN